MTVYAWARPRRFPALPPPALRVFDAGPATRLLAKCHWQPEPRAHPTIVALHGLEGSSDAHYMLGLADKAFLRGFNVVRLNQRNCGGTEALSEGLYHSGLTSDPMAVLSELIEHDRLDRIAVAGFSLGGNLALKLAGEYADAAPPELRAVCAVSPTIELAECIAMLERRQNCLYEWNFMRSLRARMRRKARFFPGRYDVGALWRVRRLRQFDDRFTAPHHGFRDASDYYVRASSMRVIGGIRIPALVITAEDDPFIPVAPARAAEVAANPHITAIVTRCGGHCGFVGPSRDHFDGYWAEQAIVEFASEATRPEDQRHAGKRTDGVYST